MILTVRYRGKPLTLDLQEHVETLDRTNFDGSDNIDIRSLQGAILAGKPDAMKPGDEIRIRSRGLHARFYLLQRGNGAIRSNGPYRLPTELNRVA